MSESWTETLHTLRRWRKTRLSLALFSPAAAVLALASAVGQDLPWSELLGRLITAFAAIALLRLWDDLEDSELDRRTHVDRVWLGDASVRIAIILTAGLSAVALCASQRFVALYAALFVFYRTRPSPLEAVLLLKYPVLVALLRGALDRGGGAAILLIYGGMLLDARHRATGAAVCALAALSLLLSAPLPGAVLLGVNLVLPFVRSSLGRAGLLAAIVVELLVFHLVDS